MPHNASWFNFLPNYEALMHLAGRWFGTEHDGAYTTYVAHSEVGLQHVLGLLLVLVIVAVLGIRAKGALANQSEAIVPDGSLTARQFIEGFVGFVYSNLEAQMDKKAARFFLPFIGTFAFLIFFSNLMGIFPFFPVPTSNFNTTLGFGFIVFFATHIYGVKEHGLAYFKHFLGPVWYLSWLMLPIELISHIARPISLGIRLMANMTADHLVLGIFIGLIPFVVPLPMYALGCIVVFVQTLVFCLLSTVYIAMAIAHDGH